MKPTLTAEKSRENLTQCLAATSALSGPPAQVRPAPLFTEAAANQAHAQLCIDHADSFGQMIQRRQYVGT